MKYKVVQAPDVGAAEGTLVRLWEANLSFPYPASRKHHWYYAGNPQGAASAFMLHPEADAARAPVGCIGLGARRFSIRGEDVAAGTFVDLAVDKGHRTLFPALLLLRAARRRARETMGFAFGAPNESAAQVFVRSGSNQAGWMRRYARVLRHAAYLERHVPRPLARIAGAGVDGATSARDVVRGGRRGGARFEWVDTADARFDRLWERARGGYAIVGERSAEYVRWRFLEAPEGRRCALGALTDEGSGELLGYVAVRDQHPTAVVYDLFASPEHLELLVASALPRLRERGFASVSVGFFGSPVLEAALEAHGFRHREDGLGVVVDSFAHPAARLLEDAACWYLTDGDLDT